MFVSKNRRAHASSDLYSFTQVGFDVYHRRGRRGHQPVSLPFTRVPRENDGVVSVSEMDGLMVVSR